jgi:hypothetical protein
VTGIQVRASRSARHGVWLSYVPFRFVCREGAEVKCCIFDTNFISWKGGMVLWSGVLAGAPIKARPPHPRGPVHLPPGVTSPRLQCSDAKPEPAGTHRNAAPPERRPTQARSGKGQGLTSSTLAVPPSPPSGLALPHGVTTRTMTGDGMPGRAQRVGLRRDREALAELQGSGTTSNHLSVGKTITQLWGGSV